ncbi:hypothetical protein KQ910_13345 [Reyranella sp. MMS21-HV4-11]|uniref:Uncharacterized protein n=1 Tax=Reyranella humidisoli TaxID=2849149 RepID=A0ABS6IJH1_9HYPH|nr:hypothetical protein [Reyranella sp. MMS21-HV4-11]MBU8874754.1 hypothetical protein [Reyranella sp. MMS21-HV4-11]
MAQKNDKSEKSEKSTEYVVVDNPFYDGVQLHPIGARILWSGPPGLSLVPVGAPRRRSGAEAPIFGDPLAGRGDGTPVKAARPGDQVVLVQ